jgi:hypothetical protein
LGHLKNAAVSTVLEYLRQQGASGTGAKAEDETGIRGVVVRAW